MQPLASISDVLARGIDSDRCSLQDLADASAAVRDAAGSPITAETCTVTVMGGGGLWLAVPAPCTAVTAVSVDDVAVTGWKRFPHRLYHEDGWGDWPSVVQITGTFGLAACPADIVRLVVDLAVLAHDSDPADLRIRSESIDDYQVTMTGEAVSAVEIPERTRAALRQRFSGNAHVTGVRW